VVTQNGRINTHRGIARGTAGGFQWIKPLR
jgi:hypothetical protein